MPQTPLFSAKILQEDKDMWLDVQVCLVIISLIDGVQIQHTCKIQEHVIYKISGLCYKIVTPIRDLYASSM